MNCVNKYRDSTIPAQFMVVLGSLGVVSVGQATTQSLT